MAKQVVVPGQEDLAQGDQQTFATGAGLSSITLEESQRQQAYREAHPELYAYVPIDAGGSFFSFKNIFTVVLTVAPFLIPGIGTAIGAAILGESAAALGAAVGLTAGELSAAVGASAISAAQTAAQGGSAEQILKSAASAGVSTGLNLGLGGGVGGAVAGSTVGTIIGGGDAQKIVTNALAAGAGAGVAGIYGQTAGTAVRNLVQTGSIEQALLAGALSEIGQQINGTSVNYKTSSSSQPVGQPFQYAGVTYQELADGTAQTTSSSGVVRIMSAETFNEIKDDYRADVASGAIQPSSSGPVTYTGTSSSAPVGQPFQYAGNTYQELEDGTARVVQGSGGATLIMSKNTFDEIKQDYAADIASGAIQPSAGTSLSPVTVVGSYKLQDTVYDLLSNGGASYVDVKGTKHTLTPQDWEIEKKQLSGGSSLPSVTVIGSAQLQDTIYDLLSDGGASYVDSRGIKHTLTAQDWEIEKRQLSGGVSPPAANVSTTSTTNLPPVNVNASNTSSTTSLDNQVLNLINKTTANTTPVTTATANTAPSTSTTTPASTPVSAPKLKTEASVARSFLNNMGIVTVGMSAEELARQLKILSPTNDYEITNFTEELAPVLDPVTVTANASPDTQILNIIKNTSNDTPKLEPVTITATTSTPTLKPVVITATTSIPTLPPWWEQIDTTPKLDPITITATTSTPTLKPVVITATTSLPTLPSVVITATTGTPTLPSVVITATTGTPTLPRVVITATTGLPTLPPVVITATTGFPTLPPVVITATTSLPTLPPVVITATTSLPTLPPVVITATTSLPTLPPVVIRETTSLPTLPPVIITATTSLPTLPPVVITATTSLPTLPPVTITPTTKPPVTTLPPSTTAPPTTPPTTKKVTYPVVTQVPPPKKPALTTITGVRPARLLADALAAYRPPGAIEGDESGKERQNVWNEKSLRLKDALGL